MKREMTTQLFAELTATEYEEILQFLHGRTERT
jgi:hypothetical protein